MFKYTCLNAISEKGTSLFGADFEKTEDIREADAVMIRSASMHEMELPPMLEAVARAGAGVNNIPLEKCAEQGIVVFNTPGANANGVKELVLAGLLLASRDIIGGVAWVQSEKDSEDLGNGPRRRKSILPAASSKERSSASSAWEPSAFSWPTRQSIWIWRSTAMIPTFPWTAPGSSPEISIISRM